MSEHLAPGERLRLERTGRAMSQEELGGDVFRASYVSRVEAGQRNGSERFWAHAAHRLEVTAAYLLTGAANDEFLLTEAMTAAASGDLRGAEKALVELLAPGAARKHVRAAALDGLVDICERSGQPSQALQYLAARTELGFGSPLDQARCAWRMVEGLLDLGDLHQAADLARDQLAQAEDSGVAATLPGIRLRTSYARALRLRGDLRTASEQIRIATQDVANAADLPARAAVLLQAAQIAAERDQFEQATQLATFARDLLVVNGDRTAIPRVHITAAEIALAGEAPDFRALRAELAGALRGSEIAGDALAEGLIHLLLARIGLAQDDLDEAADQVRQAEARIGPQAPGERARVATTRAQIAARVGDREIAAQGAAAAFQLLRSAPVAGDRSWEELAVLFEELDDLSGALDCYRALAGRRRN